MCARFVFAVQCVSFYEVIVYSIWFMFLPFSHPFLLLFLSIHMLFSSSFFMIHLHKSRCRANINLLSWTRKPSERPIFLFNVDSTQQATGYFKYWAHVHGNISIISSVERLEKFTFQSFNACQCLNCYVCACAAAFDNYHITSVQMKSKNL